MLKNLASTAFVVGTLLAATMPAVGLAQHRGGSGGGSHGSAGGFSGHASGGAGQSFSGNRGGGFSGSHGNAQSFSGGSHSYMQRGFSGGSHFYGGHPVYRGGYDYPRFYGGRYRGYYSRGGIF